MATHSSILDGESHGQRSLKGYSPWGHKKSDKTKVTQHACVYSHLSFTLSPSFFFLQCHVTCRDLSSPIRD